MNLPGRFLFIRHRLGEIRRGLPLLWLLLAPAALAQASTAPGEYSLRAAFTFNFLKFTQWPAANATDLIVCSASDDARLTAALETLGGRRVRQRLVTVIPHSPQAVCDVVVVDSRAHWLAIAGRHARRPVLTIGGYAGFVADGGMIELSFDQGAAHFDINLAQARLGELRFYPELLRLARRVIDPGG